MQIKIIVQLGNTFLGEISSYHVRIQMFENSTSYLRYKIWCSEIFTHLHSRIHTWSCCLGSSHDAAQAISRNFSKLALKKEVVVDKFSLPTFSCCFMAPKEISGSCHRKISCWECCYREWSILFHWVFDLRKLLSVQVQTSNVQAGFSFPGGM